MRSFVNACPPSRRFLLRAACYGRRAGAASVGIALLGLALQGSPVLGQSQSSDPKAAYTAIHAREAVLRRDLDTQTGASAPLHRRIRDVVAEYERMARIYPLSGYSDNALYQAAALSADAFWSFGDDADRRTALRLFSSLGGRFPTSSLNRQVDSLVARLQSSARAKSAPPTSVPRGKPPSPAGNLRPSPETSVPVALKAIRRESLPDVLRVTLELDREISFREERIEAPSRVFIDLKHAAPAAVLRDAVLTFGDDTVRQARVGRPLDDVTRVVFDLQTAARHSVYVLYDPFRLVVDFERPRPAKTAPTTKVARAAKPAPALDVVAPVPGATWTPDPLPGRPIAAASAAMLGIGAPTPGPSRKTAGVAVDTPPVAPTANMTGGFSLSRQLGLGIARIVIDPGHGGHDPGARIQGLSEADLVLDVALRLQKLLASQPGVTVSLTRRSNVYIPLEQRTAIANREEADLFLSIHANASENENARGIETYFLNFAPNPDAERIAARENSGGSRTMHSLPDIVKAIALNNKIDESRDFAALIQESMYERLRKSNRNVKDLGVKQAPFMVLIGAQMPSVLAEISFITNKDEGALLKTPGYRQQIAEALLSGVMRYQKAVKATQTIAKQ
jgi:N-acetylmuramoyl-L-alanine amidase